MEGSPGLVTSYSYIISLFEFYLFSVSVVVLQTLDVSVKLSDTDLTHSVKITFFIGFDFTCDYYNGKLLNS